MDNIKLIEYLKARLARMQEAQGWTNEHTYDRYWKKDVAELKKHIKALEKAQGK